MGQNAAYSYGDIQGIKCGCSVQLEVSITKQDGHNEKENFTCPSCGLEHFVIASMPVRVSDIKIVKVDE